MQYAVFHEVVFYFCISFISFEYCAYQMINQVIYKIKLPGPAILGEGKPENQNHAIIFSRGEGLQTIDMNQVKCHM